MSPKRFGMHSAVTRTGSWLGLVLTLASAPLFAQTCTTQARMSDTVRSGLSGAALDLAQAVKAADASKVEAATIAEFSSPAAFAPTAAIIQSTSGKLAGDTLRVTQIYQLDARERKPGDTSEADFSCALANTTSETDFSITGLPPGLYGFAMVEAAGDRPWLLSFLLRQDSGIWKLAGFYPHARTIADHDGLWFWTTARADVKAKEPWLAWVYFSEADVLLRPASFVTSTNLDRMRAEQTAAAPPELINGISADNALIVKAPDGKEYRFTSFATESSEDGKQVKLVLHMSADYIADPTIAKARNNAATAALFDAHKELREAFNNVWTFADSPGQLPLLTEKTINEIP